MQLGGEYVEILFQNRKTQRKKICCRESETWLFSALIILTKNIFLGKCRLYFIHFTELQEEFSKHMLIPSFPGVPIVYFKANSRVSPFDLTALT